MSINPRLPTSAIPAASRAARNCWAVGRALTLGTLFSGIEGFGQGFERTGARVAWQCEIDRDCRKVLARHYPGVPCYEDVSDVRGQELQPVDVIAFGSPCQDLSVAGNRAGLDGARSGLFFEGLRVVAECQPAFALWENVPGVLSSNAGRDFLAVLRAFRDIGARDIAWRTLDAQYFGLAQRRRRVFLVADFRGERAAEILFERESGGGDTQAGRETGQDLAGTLTGGSTDPSYHGAATGRDRMLVEVASFDPRNVTSWANRSRVEYGLPANTLHAGGLSVLARTLSARQERLDGDSDNFIVAATLGSHGTYDRGDGVDNLVAPIALSNRGHATGEIGETLRSDSHGAQPMVMAFTERTRAGGRNFEAQEELAYALTNPGAGGRARERQIAGGFGVRRLLPIECEKLQGFSPGWTEFGADGQPISDSARYRMLGNAVAVPVAEWIARRIVKVRNEYERTG